MYEALLAEARVLTVKHEALIGTAHSFNLFSILDRETDEVHTHSAILAELLNPNGSHGQGAVFATHFAKRVGICREDIKTARVSTEKAIGTEGRADILIETDQMCVVIENKIYAADQPIQLERYHHYASRWKYPRVFYLTLHGNAPSEYTLGALGSDKVIPISYKKHIVGWLEDCIKEVVHLPQIREILSHYQVLLRKLTGTTTGELTMDLKSLLKEKVGGKHNFELMPGLVDAMTELSVDIEWTFWQRIKERLEADARLTHKPNAPFREVAPRAIRHAHGPGNKDRWWYGWTFQIECDDPGLFPVNDVRVVLRVEYRRWRSLCVYGFVALSQTGERLHRSENVSEIFGDWERRMSDVEGDWNVKDEKWLAVAASTEEVVLEKTNWLRPDVLGKLMDDRAVDGFVDDVRTTLDRIAGTRSGSA